MNILLLTSCNRIKQVLLSLSINAQIIEDKFSVVIVDSSTPDLKSEIACKIHDDDDPYNLVKPHNYCNDVNLLYHAQKWFPKWFKNIEEFKVIHYSPRLLKQMGDSTSTAIGLTQAALIGNRRTGKQNYCLKLTGTSILTYDVVSQLPHLLKEKDILTWHRANIGGEQRSTRIFGSKPDILVPYILKEGWGEWCDDKDGIFEERFAKIINKYLSDRINYTQNDEVGILLEGGSAMKDEYARKRIESFIELNKINSNATPYLRQFNNGEIW